MKIWLLAISLIMLISCDDNSFTFSVTFPEDIKLKVGENRLFYLVLSNEEDRIVNIDNIRTSCQCIIVSKTKIELKPNSIDSIQVELHGLEAGKKTESIYFVNNELKKFEIIKVKYNIFK